MKSPNSTAGAPYTNCFKDTDSFSTVWVDDLDRNTLARELVGRGERRVHVVREPDDRHVRAGALHVGDPDRHDMVAVGDGPLQRGEPAALERDDGVVVANRALQQSLRVG